MNSKLYTIAVQIEWLVNTFVGLWPRFSCAGKLNHDAKHKVLILREDSIGDFVLFSCALEQYRKLFSSSHLVLVVSSDVYEFAKNCPSVDEVWSIDVRRFRTSLVEKIRWLRRVREARFDIAIHSVFSLGFEYVEPIVWWSRAGRRIAHECVEMGRSRRLSPFYTELVTVDGLWKHELFRNYDMLRYLGYTGPPPMRPKVWLNDGAINMRLRTPYGVVVPGARSSLRRWPAEMFGEAISRVHQSRILNWVLLGAESEEAICRELSDVLTRNGVSHINLVGRTTLQEAAHIIKQARVCLGNESGLVHIAIAQGTPVVTIVGGGHYARFFPYPDNQRQYVVNKAMECYYCNWRCIFNRTRCIEEVPVDAVAGALQSALSEAIGKKT